jgi:ferredoxin hydrogenase large subunit
MSYFQVNDKCNGCLACVQNCPAGALGYTDKKDTRTLRHNMARCARCLTCWRVCPQDAVEFEHLLINRWDEVVTLILLRCRVCGEPIHTARLTEDIDEKLVDMTEPLCARHRARSSAKERLLDRR